MPSRRPNKYGHKFRPRTTLSNPKWAKTVQFSSLRSTEATSQDEKFEAIRLASQIDEAMGFPRFESGEKRVGWLINMHSTSIEDRNVPGGRAGVDFYFLQDDGDSFKATLEYDPYFLIAVKRGHEAEVEEWCRRMFEGVIKNVKRVEKEDLQMPNHLVGYRRTFLQLSFANVSRLLEARKTIMPIAEKNKKNVTAMDTYAEMARFDSY
jgi:DNA polymerase epsilon subunit 1